MDQRYLEEAYHKTLLGITGLMRALSRIEISFPSRWQGLFDTLQVYSGFAYSTLSMLDEDVDREVQELEERFDRSFGDKKYYSEEEVEKISEEFSDLSLG